MASTFVFPDTNTFLHYPPVDQIDWTGLLQVGSVVLVITPVVIRELNKHKDFPRTSKVREHAAAALSRLHGWSEEAAPITIRSGVELEFRTNDPLIDFSAKNLSHNVADDHFIATVLEHKTEHPDRTHIIVTEDLGLKLKAKNFGFLVCQLPADKRLQDESLDSEKKINQLEAQLREMKNRIPVLSLAFPTGENWINISVREPQELTPELVRDAMAKLQSMHPKREQPKKSASVIKLGEIEIPVADFQGVNTSTEEITQYNDSLDKYYKEYESYLYSKQDFLNLQNRTVRIEIVLLNEGSCPAEDIEIFMHFPGGFALSEEDKLPESPNPPKAPRPPRTFTERMNDVFYSPALNLPSVMDSYLTPRMMPIHRNVGYPLIRRTKSYDVQIRVDKAKHGLVETLDPLFLTFDSTQDAGSFTIDYAIHAANLPEAVNGKLHVVVKNEATPSGAHKIPTE